MGMNKKVNRMCKADALQPTNQSQEKTVTDKAATNLKIEIKNNKPRQNSKMIFVIREYSQNFIHIIIDIFEV